MTETSPSARIEHVNLTVSDLDRSIALFQSLCGWHLRLRAMHGARGEFAHVGTDEDYLALWADGGDHSGQAKGRPLNHVGLQVADLDAAERAVRDAGLETFSHGKYEPGPRTFYFFHWDGIEFEVVSYA
ncbi:VOC family protein [Aurantiacibacter luteus]|uniref:VOC family protein n=1 Tax=Aurantiacibacter luteus TaxID=1581420 RepID=UPI00069BB739|nr:VOC family protein [Aurantiacibacter luteus]